MNRDIAFEAEFKAAIRAEIERRRAALAHEAELEAWARDELIRVLGDMRMVISARPYPALGTDLNPEA